MTEEHGRYEVKGQEVRREARLPCRDPRYKPPTPEEIRAVLRVGNLTGSAAGELLDVEGRTIRKWTGGDQRMPYSAWRLLLIELGMALEGRVAVGKVASP